jgi:hypothetical protein
VAMAVAYLATIKEKGKSESSKIERNPLLFGRLLKLNGHTVNY